MRGYHIRRARTGRPGSCGDVFELFNDRVQPRLHDLIISAGASRVALGARGNGDGGDGPGAVPAMMNDSAFRVTQPDVHT